MKQEEKDLLLKDLCARLPYGVVIRVDEKTNQDDEPLYGMRENGGKLLINDAFYIEEIKPYLFPLSSMTEKQKEELQELYFDYIPDEIFNDVEFVYHYDCIHLIDWLNKNHFDYRGLILMGLANDATGLNIY